MMKFVCGFIVVALCIFLIVRMCTQKTSESLFLQEANQMLFFKEIEAIEPFDLLKPSFLKASDGLELAYYAFANSGVKHIVILYAGAGLYGNKTYQYVAKRLHEEYGIGSYIFDVRGHGHSQGKRGDAPSIQSVWDDVACAIKFVKNQHLDAKIYLTGHSSGAGLIINYTANVKNKLEDGYIFLAPYLGPKSVTCKKHTDQTNFFIKSIRPWLYFLAAIFPNSPMIHWHAVFFNYPEALLHADSLIVSSYSYTMSCATTPYDITKLLPQIKKPIALFMGGLDLLFDYSSCQVEKYGKLIEAPLISYFPLEVNHLSILLQAPQLIADYIYDDLQQ